ncbi:MAG: hypothetical protein AAF236_12055 [Verrucomicrobiota bacterium]
MVALPASVQPSAFESLKGPSPFRRVLSLAETYALRGVAQIDDISIATLYNRETEKTLVILPQPDAETGLALLSIIEAEALGDVRATIGFDGEEVELRYDDSQVAPQPKPQSEKGKGGEERKGPSKEDVDRFRSLPEEKQKQLREYIGYVQRTRQDMSREERGNLIRGAMMRLVDGRELPDFPRGQTQPQSGQQQPQQQQRGGGNQAGGKGRR